MDWTKGMTRLLSSRALKLGLTVLFLLLLGLLSLRLISRYQAEQAYQNIRVVLDYEDWRSYIRQNDLEETEVFTQLKSLGFKAVALDEKHFFDLRDSGRAELLSSLQLQLLASQDLLGGIQREEIHFEGSYLLVKRPQHLPDLLENLKEGLGRRSIVEVLEGEDILLVGVRAGERELTMVGLGFDRLEIEAAKRLGFELWLRPENLPLADAQWSKKRWEELAQIEGVRGVIFGGPYNQVLGYPDSLDQSAEEIKENPLAIAYLEATPATQQKGIEFLVRSQPDKTLRLFSLNPAYQNTLSPLRIASMLRLAVEERNIALVYLRPYASGKFVKETDTLMQKISEYLGPSFSSESEALPFWSREFGKYSTPLTLIFLSLIALGGAICSALFFRGSALGENRWIGRLPFAVFAFFLFLTLVPALLGKLHIGIASACLINGFTWPLVGMWLLADRLDETKDGERISIGGVFGWILLIFFLSFFASLVIGALMSGPLYQLGVERFRGVKLLTLGVPFSVLLFWLLRFFDLDWLKKQLAKPLTYSALVLGLVVAVGIFFYLLRSGNAGAGSVSGTEQFLRVWLDDFFGVRPRFKEFLLGYPALVLAFWALRKHLDLLFSFLIAIGAISLAGALDTFAHAHTPLMVSTIRSVLGLGLGLIVGGFLWFLCETFYKLLFLKKQ